MGYGHLSCDRVDDLLLSMEVNSWDNHLDGEISIAMFHSQEVIFNFAGFSIYVPGKHWDTHQ